jgi:hypothetical protein
MIHAFVFNAAGLCEPASDAARFNCDDLNARPIIQKIWKREIDPAPSREITVVLAAARPWAQAAVLARCALVIASNSAVEVYAPSEAAYDEFVSTVTGLASWANVLADPDPDAAAAATRLCSAVLSRPDLDRDDPTVEATRAAIVEILATVGVGGRA